MAPHTRTMSLVARPFLMLALMGACAAGSSSSSSGSGFSYANDDALTLFDIQMKGTHNSYHQFSEVDLQAWNYQHLPLADQAEYQGVRAFELDLHFVPDAGTVNVLHIPTLDDRTSCATLAACLDGLASWSDAHPAHHPMVVQFEGKGFVNEDTVDAFLVAVEATLEAHLGRARLITPRDVQRTAPTLAQALQMWGWPSLAQTRGRFLLAWDETGLVRDRYTHGGTTLEDRLMFADSAPSDPFAAVAILNDPVGQADAIGRAQAAHMLVRSRADTDGEQAYANDFTRLQAALAVGAHIITTDYPVPAWDGGYAVSIPGGTPSRCNPVTSVRVATDAGRPCQAVDLEDPAFMQ